MDISEFEDMIDNMFLVKQKNSILFHHKARKELAERIKKEVHELN